MKLYSTGLIGLIATVASLVANIQLMEKFNTTHPYIYWGGQIILCLAFFSMTLYTLIHWDKEVAVTKQRFTLSVFICICMYAIAYTRSQYAFILILVIGITEIFLTRKRFGFVKRSGFKEQNK